MPIPDEAWIDEVPEEPELPTGAEGSSAPVDERKSFPEEAELPEGRFGRKIKVRLKDKTGSENHGHGNPTHAVRLLALEKAAEIYALRLKGWSYRELAYKYQVSPGNIHKILVRESEKLQKKTLQSAEHVRTLMEERLDFMWKSLYPLVEAGSARAAEMGLKIMERQARLYGLDAPERKEVDVTVTNLTDVEIVTNALRAGIPREQIPIELLRLAGMDDVVDGEVIPPEALNDHSPETATEPADGPQT